MEICTEPLTPDRLHQELPLAVEWMREQGVKTLYAWFGAGCKVARRDRGALHPLGIGEVIAFVRQSVERGALQLGQGELHMDLAHWARRRKQPKVVPRFTLGRDYDLRFESDDDLLIQSMRSAWISRGLRGYQRTDRTTSDWIEFPASA